MHVFGNISLKNEDKIVELLAEMLVRQDRMLASQEQTNARLDITIARLDLTIARLDEVVLGAHQTNVKLDQTIARLDKVVEEQQAMRGNIFRLEHITEEHAGLLRRLGDKIDKLGDLQHRVLLLEDAVFKKAS